MNWQLSGRTRYRPLRKWRTVLLVLQVELTCDVTLGDYYVQPGVHTLWRDARVEDLAELEQLKEKA